MLIAVHNSVGVWVGAAVVGWWLGSSVGKSVGSREGEPWSEHDTISVLVFAPSSSQNWDSGDPTVVDLPPGAIHSKPNATSYILTERILLVSRPRLRQGPFEYKPQLAPKYARVIRKALPQ